jgi:hypothetical protein
MSAPMKCVLCWHILGKTVAATGIIDGTSLCDDCQWQVIDVINNGTGSHLWFDTNGRFSAIATIINYKKASMK